MALDAARLKSYTKEQLEDLAEELAFATIEDSEFDAGVPTTGPADARQTAGRFPSQFAQMVDNLLDEHHYPMAIQIVEMTMTDQWHPQWFLTGELLRARPGPNCSLDEAIRAQLCVRRICNFHPPRKILRDIRQMEAGDDDGANGDTRANAANTFRIWDMLDDAIKYLVADDTPEPSPEKPQTRDRKRKKPADVQSSPEGKIKVPGFDDRPKVPEIDTDFKKEFGRILLGTVVFILQRDSITKEDDLRDTFLYRSFQQVERISKRVEDVLAKLIRLAVDDEDSLLTLIHTQELLQQLAIVSDSFALKGFPDLLVRELARCDTGTLDVFFDSMQSQSLKLRIARDLLLSDFHFGENTPPPNLHIETKDIISYFCNGRPTKGNLKNRDAWFRLVRLLAELIRGFIQLQALEITEVEAREFSQQLAIGLNLLRKDMDAAMKERAKPRRKSTRIAASSSDDDTDSGDEEFAASIDGWLKFLPGAWETIVGFDSVE